MIRTLTLVPAVLFCAVIAAQPGSIDHSFNATDIGFGYGDGADHEVLTTTVQSDGRIMIGGIFDEYNHLERKRIARVNVDGKVDSTFNPGVGPNGGVTDIAVQPDGKYLIAGYYNSFNGLGCSGLVRLNPNGTLDSSFTLGTPLFADVNSVDLQPDGKILIGGNFSSYNQSYHSHIARLNPDGTTDSTFIPGLGPAGGIEDIALQADGKIIAVGNFGAFDGILRNRIVRLHPDGTVDGSFDPGTGADLQVRSVAVQADGKILIAGDFNTIASIPRKGIARLNTDGSVDFSFNPGTGFGGLALTLLIQSDGRIIVVGDFSSYNGATHKRIVRLNVDGSFDPSFSSGDGANTLLWDVAVQPDGMILISGNFTSYDGTPVGHMTRLHVDGAWDASFNTGTGANGVVRAVRRQPDGRILVGGSFLRFNGTTITRIARLNTDGSLDASFDPGSGADDVVWSIALQPDARILIAGQFTSYDGAFRNRIVRINTDGSLDASFNPGAGASGIILSMALQPDGRILIGGEFTSYNGTPISRVARLNTDGSLDLTFNPGTGANNTIRTVTLEPNGKILIAGEFDTYNGTGRTRIARLNADGSLDTGFDPGTGANGGILSTALQPDGKILIGGIFGTYNGTLHSRFARLNADGGIDSSFDPGTAANGFVSTIFLQPDARILIGGYFNTYDGIGRVRLARVNPDGSLDLSFDPGTGANDGVLGFDLQPDGGILVGGQFTSYDGIGRNRVARLNGDIGTSSGEGPGPNDVLRVFPNPTTGLVHIDHSVVGPTELIVLDSYGRVVWTRDLRSSGSPCVLDLQGLAAGVYHLEVRSADPPARSTVLLHR